MGKSESFVKAGCSAGNGHITGSLFVVTTRTTYCVFVKKLIRIFEIKSTVLLKTQTTIVKLVKLV